MKKLIDAINKVKTEVPGISSVDLQVKVCQALDISRATFYRKLKRLPCFTSGNVVKPQAVVVETPSEAPSQEPSQKEAPEAAPVVEPEIVNTAAAQDETSKMPSISVGDEREFLKLVPSAADIAKYVPGKRFDLHEAIVSDTSSGLFIHGPSGSGKTLFFEVFAGRRKLPRLTISMDPETSVSSLYGGISLVDGTSSYNLGLLSRVLLRPSVVIFEEMNVVGQAFILHQTTNDRKFFLKDANRGKGQVFNVHPGCHIGFTANVGYTGTTDISKALIDRVYVDKMEAPSPKELCGFLTGKGSRKSIISRPLPTLTPKVIDWNVEAPKLEKALDLVAQAADKAEKESNLSFRLMKKLQYMAPIIGLEEALVVALIRPYGLIHGEEYEKEVYGLVKTVFDVNITY